MKKSLLLLGIVLGLVITSCGGGGGGGDGDGDGNIKKLAVALRGTGEIGIVDLEDNTIIDRYPIGGAPQSIDVTPDKTKFYVTSNTGNFSGDNTVYVVSVADGTVIKSIDVATDVWGVKVHPDGSKVYVTAYKDDYVIVIDTATDTVVDNIPVGQKPLGLAVSPDGSTLCVPNKDDNTVSLIDTVTDTVAHTSNPTSGVGNGPWEVAFTPDGSECWVDDSATGDAGLSDYVVTFVTVADGTSSGDLTLSFQSGFSINGIAFTPDGTKAYVGSSHSNDLFAVDTATMTFQIIETDTVDFDVDAGAGSAKRLYMDKLGKKLYYSSRDNENVTVVDVTTDTITGTIDFDAFANDNPNGMVGY